MWSSEQGVQETATVKAISMEHSGRISVIVTESTAQRSQPGQGRRVI
jgi:uncharacterized membrane protein YcaP (DUF421 family)